MSERLSNKGDSRRLCPVGYYTCSSGQCVLSVARCNAVRDCYDGSDEWRCPSESVSFAPPPHLAIFSQSLLADIFYISALPSPWSLAHLTTFLFTSCYLVAPNILFFTNPLTLNLRYRLLPLAWCLIVSLSSLGSSHDDVLQISHVLRISTLATTTPTAARMDAASTSHGCVMEIETVWTRLMNSAATVRLCLPSALGSLLSLSPLHRWVVCSYHLLLLVTDPSKAVSGHFLFGSSVTAELHAPCPDDLVLVVYLPIKGFTHSLTAVLKTTPSAVHSSLTTPQSTSPQSTAAKSLRTDITTVPSTGTVGRVSKSAITTLAPTTPTTTPLPTVVTRISCNDLFGPIKGYRRQFMIRPQNKGPRVEYPCVIELWERQELTCQPTDFHCFSSDVCIPAEQRCDYVLNCLDGSDEMHCRKWRAAFH